MTKEQAIKFILSVVVLNVISMTKEQAIRFILSVIKSPMAMMSPKKKEALDLAEKYNISAKELIEEFEKIVHQV